MNIFLREIKAQRKSFFIWCIGIVAMVAGGMSKYGVTKNAGQTMNELISSMPKALQAIMGTGSLDISTVNGYYGILFLYLIVMTTIHATMLGATIISKEERDKTAEFLLVKPISRRAVIFSKWMVSLFTIIVINMVTYVISIVMVEYYNKTNASFDSEIFQLMVGMFVLQLLFLSLGMGIAAASKKPKRATGLSTAVLLLAFFLSILIDMNERLEVLTFLTPFKYFEAKDIINGSGFEALFVVLSIILIVVFTVITFFAYEKRDLKV